MRIYMDLNILIATTVTATAALIAIIGGFLISRVITLSSEQNGIRRRLREIKLSAQTQEHLLAEIEENLLAEDQEDFILDNYVELIFDKIPLEELLEHDENPYRKRTIKDLEPVVEELIQVEADLQEMFHNRGVSYSDDLPSEYSVFFNKESLTVKHREYWYELLYDEHRLRMDSKPKEARGMFDIPNLDVAPIRTFDRVSATIQTQAGEQAYQQKHRDRDTYKNELDYLKKQEEEQEQILRDYGKPQGMWGGLFVLIYASIVGIGYPITLLPYPLETYNDEVTKHFILGLFFSLLVSLFVYLAINMHRLTKDEK